jgi:hypothetical protein
MFSTLNLLLMYLIFNILFKEIVSSVKFFYTLFNFIILKCHYCVLVKFQQYYSAIYMPIASVGLK